MKLAILVSDFESGGVERSMTHLAGGLARRGLTVDYLVGNPEHPYLQCLDARVRLRPVAGNRTATLADYLINHRPDVLMTAKLADDVCAIALREQLNLSTRLVANVGTVLSASVAASPVNPLRNWLNRRRVQRVYRQLDAIAAVSQGVAQDLRHAFGLRELPISVLPNPIISSDLASLAALPCAHPWLQQPNAPPVVLAIGGLRRVKDFPTLLRAFAKLSRHADARLIILGEGRQRSKLERLAARLHITERLALPGFVANPFPWLAQARVLALSSRREGFGNVLIEALALGTPVVATDCPSGPREALGGGRWGRLVAVGDSDALSAALLDTLNDHGARDVPHDAVQPYRVDAASAAYAVFLQHVCEPA